MRVVGEDAPDAVLAEPGARITHDCDEIYGRLLRLLFSLPSRNGFQVLAVAQVGDADAGNLPLSSIIHRLRLSHNGVITKWTPSDPATFLYKPHDPLCIGICLRDLVQCIFDEIMIFHFVLPLLGVVFTRSKAGMQ